MLCRVTVSLYSEIAMKNNKSLGFTLIEVLIALFIIAIALAAVIRATNNGIRTAIHVRDTMAAHWVGLNVISELQIGAFQLPMDGGPLRGKSVMENQVWQWVVHPQSSEKWPGSTQLTVIVRSQNKTITTVTGYLLHA